MRGTGLLVMLYTCVAGCGPSSEAPAGGACTEDLRVGDLVVTEVFADFKAVVGGSGVDDGKEWFEIYNATDRAIDLEGLRIDHSRPDGTKLETHELTAITLAPGQYFTLGNAAPDLLPPYVDYGYGTALGGLFNSDGGTLTLRCGDDVIDTAAYDEVREGHARELSAATFPDYTINDALENWCEAAAVEFEPANFGTPGSESDCQPVVIGSCNDNGTPRPTVTPEPGDLIITEVMPDPEGTDADREWFEARVMRDVDLNGVGLARATMNPNVIESADCVRVTAGSYVVFAHSLDSGTNGGLPAEAVAGTFRFALPDPGEVRIVAGSVVIDAATWGNAASGVSLALDPDLEDAVANDDAANYCAGVGAYGPGGEGTPGAANAECPVEAGEGECLDGAIARPIVKPVAGQLVITEFLANPAGTSTDAAQEWFEIANTGQTAFDLNGLELKGNAVDGNLIRSTACKSVEPGTFALFAHDGDATVNGGLPAIDATFSFGLAASNGRITVLDGTTVIDETTWQTPAVPDGVARQLDPAKTTATDNDAQANFCNATADQAYKDGALNFGTPKAANVCL